MILRGGLIVAVICALSAAFAGEARAAKLQVNCSGPATYTDIQTAVNNACSGDTISVSGACDEAVTINTQNAILCTGGALAFTQLSIKGGSSTSNNNTGAGPAFLIMGNARNITINNFTVGSAASHGIQAVSAHRVTLEGIRTAPNSFPGAVAALDGINIDTASTRVRVLSSTLNNNGDDGVENGSTDGEVSSVTANDNELAGIHVPGSNVMVTKCKADDTLAGNVQDEGFRFDGPGAIVQQCNAKDNVVAQFRDTAASKGVIHFRNVAGNSSATVVPLGAGIGFWEEGSGNRINTCSVFRNASHGVHLAGNGNTLQLSTVSSNVGDQVQITGNNNFIQSNTITRVSAPNVFASTTPAVNVPGGADANFFDSNRVSISGVTTATNGFNVVDADNNGQQNSRSPGDPLDPPLNLR